MGAIRFKSEIIGNYLNPMILLNKFLYSLNSLPLDMGHENGALFNINSILKIKKYLNSVIPELY